MTAMPMLRYVQCECYLRNAIVQTSAGAYRPCLPLLTCQLCHGTGQRLVEVVGDCQ
jgi:hypothetical protein